MSLLSSAAVPDTILTLGWAFRSSVEEINGSPTAHSIEAKPVLKSPFLFLDRNGGG
jgi:hypothetical protein